MRPWLRKSASIQPRTRAGKSDVSWLCSWLCSWSGRLLKAMAELPVVHGGLAVPIAERREAPHVPVTRDLYGARLEMAESTPTGGWCQLKKASGFTENLPNFYQIFKDFQSDFAKILRKFCQNFAKILQHFAKFACEKMIFW